MATDHIRYDVLARDALRGVLRRGAGEARDDAEHRARAAEQLRGAQDLDGQIRGG